MANIKIDVGGGLCCDFCLERDSTGKCFRTTNSGEKNGHTFNTSVGICSSCLLEAYRMLPKNNLTQIASMFSAIARRLLDKDTKTLIQAGFLSTDLSLTSEGQSALLSIMLSNSKEELVKEAAAAIEEKKEEKR